MVTRDSNSSSGEALAAQIRSLEKRLKANSLWHHKSRVLNVRRNGESETTDERSFKLLVSLSASVLSTRVMRARSFAGMGRQIYIPTNLGVSGIKK